MDSASETNMTSVAFRRTIVGIGVFLGLVAAAAGQTPPAPVVAYEEQEVTFTSGEVKLAGTLTLPAKPALAGVVLLTGSGAQNRDEELLGFRPFRVFADHLAKAGIAVLRYDDRGVGGSTGSVPASTTRDFAGDALAALALLKTRVGTSTPIGLLGQVPPAANRPPLEAALARAGNSRVSVKVYAEANHLFIKSVTGNPTEYATLDKVFVPGLLDDVSGWILAQVKP